MRASSGARATRRCVLVFATAIVLLTASGAYYATLQRTLRANDDTVWLYYTGVALFHPAEVRAFHERVTAHMESGGGDADTIRRWSLRHGYGRNYLVTSFVLYTTAHGLVPLVVRGEVPYASFLARALTVGFALTFALSLAAIAIALVACHDWVFASTVAAAMATLAFLSLLPIEPPRAGALVPEPTLFAQLKYGATILVNPGAELGMFGYTPRSQLVLLTFLVAALRSRGVFAWSYAVVLALAFVHQSMAGFVLVSFVLADLLLRPGVLIAPPTLVSVVTALSLFLLRDALLTRFGVLVWVVLLLGLTVLVSLVVRRAEFAEALASIGRIGKPLARWRSRAGETVCDLVTFGLLWIAGFALTSFAYRYADPAMRYHFWGELSGRHLAILQPVLVLGLWVEAVRRLSAPRSSRRRLLPAAVLAVSACLTLPVLGNAARIAATDAVSPNVQARVARTAALLSTSIPKVTTQHHEAALYYAISATIDTGRDVFTPLIPRRDEGRHSE
jgi:hypothetical protein